MAVGRDHAPPDEVPALVELLQRHDERVRRPPAERRGGPAVCWCASASVTETIANRGSTASLYVSRSCLRRRVHRLARGRDRAEERRVRPRGRRQRRAPRRPPRGRLTPVRLKRVSASPSPRRARLPRGLPRARRPRARSTPPSTSLPPPSESSDSIVGAGVSELSAPVQSTTEPSEYVCLTPNVYVFAESVPAEEREAGGLAGRHLAAVPRHLRDHGVLARARLLRPSASSPARR